jgi:hypothetical protein
VVLGETVGQVKFPGAQRRLNWPCWTRSFIHHCCMLKDFESFWRILELRMPWAVLLSASRGGPVLGCLWPGSSSMARMGQVCRPPCQMLPVLASEAEETTFFMVLHRMSMAPLTRSLLCQRGGLRRGCKLWVRRDGRRQRLFEDHVAGVEADDGVWTGVWVIH